MKTIELEQMVRLPVGGVTLQGDLAISPAARGVVLFAHGSGSSRRSPRNRFVAGRLHRERLGTLLLDLLTPSEERVDDQTARLRFDIDMLAARLSEAARWLLRNQQTRGLPIGYFGASTGAGAALVAASRDPEGIGAVVSRGGRPDLAGPFLGRVRAPTLLIVGGEDTVVIDMNEEAYQQLRCEKEMRIVPGATHLFEEPGALEAVAELAAGWFARWLPVGPG
jgi:putative phosphoribosyl transferase